MAYTEKLCNRLTSMKHIEVHVVNTPTDLELAYIAGLLEGEGAPFFITCELCEELILLASTESNKGGGHIILLEEHSITSCYSCVGLALSDIGE